MKLTTEIAKQALETTGHTIEEQKRLPSNLGDQICLSDNVKVSVFNTGKFSV